MESVNTREDLLLEDQSSRKKRKISIIISFIIIFTLMIGSIVSVFTILKPNEEYQSFFALKPTKAIQEVCSLTPYYSSCFNSIWRLQRITPSSEKLNPTRIFTLSLQAAFNHLNNSISPIQREISKVNDSRTLSALKNCENLIHDSSRLIDISITRIADSPDDKFFKEFKNVSNLKEWISNAKANIDRCLADYEGSNYTGYFMIHDHEELIELKMKLFSAKMYVDNSFVILRKMDLIVEMLKPSLFNPQIVQSMRARILHYAFAIGIYCSQYVVLVVLLCLVLRLK